MNRSFYFFALAILLTSCSTSTNEKKDSVQTAKEVKGENEALNETVLSNGTPVYNYDQLEGLINKDDGTTYVINFWATWCKPCVEELPYFEQLTETYDEDEVKVILVSLDFKKQFEKKLVPFMADRNLQSEVMVLLDPDSNRWINEVNTDWSGAIPATVIHNGDKREFREGSYESFEELNEIVKKYL